MSFSVEDIFSNDKVDLNGKYFHSFKFDDEIFTDIINHGIKCRLLQGKIDKNHTNNGSFYISLYRDKGKSKSSIINMLESNPCMIIDGNIKAFRTSDDNFSIFCNTPFPMRYSPYDTEYQRFLRISPKRILGVGVNLEGELTYRLHQLSQITDWIDDLNKDIDIIEVNSGCIIDKNKVKENIKF